jgi:hypothetical protein
MSREGRSFKYARKSPSLHRKTDVIADLQDSNPSPKHGLGRGRTSVFQFLSEWFLGWPIYGGGFGSSSLCTIIYWGGWAFLWTPYGIFWLYGAEVGGTPLHEIAGSMTGSEEMISAIASS